MSTNARKHRAWPVLLSAALLAGCGAASPPAPTPPPSVSERSVSERSASEPSASEPTEQAEASGPLSEVMAELVAGERSLASVVDRERGLVHVLWKTDPSDVDPRRDEDGIVQVAERLCGPALDEAIARFDEVLRARGDDPPEEPVFTCEGDTCRHPARMEFDVVGTYVFGAERPPRLHEIVEIEGHLTDEARATAERWAEAQRARLEVGGCE